LVSDASVWTKVLPQLEQPALYNSLNTSIAILARHNRTVQAALVGVFCCPSDPTAAVRDGDAAFLVHNGYSGYTDPGEALPMGFTSYLACFGTTDTLSHVYPDARGFAKADGAFAGQTPIRLESIRDGLGQTIFASERATAYLEQLSTFDPTIFRRHGWYFFDDPGDTLLLTFYPPNMPKKVAAEAGAGHAMAASSLHPGGINALMGDGSVRFIKDTISSWPFDPISGWPMGATEGPGGNWEHLPRPGTWQALTTRDGREIIGSDAY